MLETDAHVEHRYYKALNNLWVHSYVPVFVVDADGRHRVVSKANHSWYIVRIIRPGETCPETKLLSRMHSSHSHQQFQPEIELVIFTARSRTSQGSFRSELQRDDGV